MNPVVEFVDSRIEVILRFPDGWGDPDSVELQLLLLLEVRHVALGKEIDGGPVLVLNPEDYSYSLR